MPSWLSHAIAQGIGAAGALLLILSIVWVLRRVWRWFVKLTLDILHDR